MKIFSRPHFYKVPSLILAGRNSNKGTHLPHSPCSATISAPSKVTSTHHFLWWLWEGAAPLSSVTRASAAGRPKPFTSSRCRASHLPEWNSRVGLVRPLQEKLHPYGYQPAAPAPPPSPTLGVHGAQGPRICRTDSIIGVVQSWFALGEWHGKGDLKGRSQNQHLWRKILSELAADNGFYLQRWVK